MVVVNPLEYENLNPNTFDVIKYVTWEGFQSLIYRFTVGNVIKFQDGYTIVLKE